jgi:hypothetical protein
MTDRTALLSKLGSNLFMICENHPQTTQKLRYCKRARKALLLKGHRIVGCPSFLCDDNGPFFHFNPLGGPGLARG